MTIVDDSAHEGSEALGFSLRPGAGYTTTRISDFHEIVITDDDPIIEASFASASQRAGEGAGTRNVTVNLVPAAPTDLTLSYTVGGTATAGSDYTALSGSVEISSGDTTVTIPVAILDDSDEEGEETVVLTLTGGGGWRVGGEGYLVKGPSTHTLTIAGSDGGSPQRWITPAFASSASRVGEGAGTHRVSIELLPPPVNDRTLKVRIDKPRDRTNEASSGDYRIDDGNGWTPHPDRQNHWQYTVGPGVTSVTFPVRIVDDSVREGDETIRLYVSLLTYCTWCSSEPDPVWIAGLINYRHTVTVADNDGPAAGAPVASFASAASNANEGSGTRNVAVTLLPAATSAFTLNYTVDGTATASSDYTALSGTVSVSPGDTTATIPVTITDDSDEEDSETVELTLTPGSGYTVGAGNTHTLTVAASDAPQTIVSFASASQRVVERSGTRNVTVNLSPPPASDITLNYTVGGTATPGLGYETLSGTLPVSAGAATATIPVTLLADSDQEDRETVVLTLAPGTGYRLVSRAHVLTGTTAFGTCCGTGPSTHTLNIDIVMPAVFFRLPLEVVSESVGTYRVPVHLSPPPPSDITISFTAVGITATPGEDYEPQTGTVVVPAGAAKAYIPVTIIDDSVEDSGEWVELWLEDSVYTEDAGGRLVKGNRLPGYTVGSRYANLDLIITNHEANDLAGRVQARLDAAVAGGDSASANLWRRALAAVRGEAPPNGLARLTQADAQAQSAGHAGQGETELASLWSLIAEVIGSGVTDPSGPEVTIAADAASVTEGTGASFTLTATPAPATPLAVTVTVATSGDYGITAGETTYTIPTTGSYTLTLATDNDGADEAHGSVSVTIDAGDGYTVGTASSDTVAVEDDDVPEIEIAADTASVTEGGDASFTLTADPAPAAPLAVTVTVAASGDYGITAGETTHTIPTTGAYTLTLATDNDGADEADGSVSVTVDAGDGYTVGTASSGTVAIEDNDAPAPVLPAAHPLMKYASLVKTFYDRITARHVHGDSASGGWNKRFLKALEHPEYVDYPQAAVTVADATRLWNHGGPGANTAWNGTVEAVTYAEQYFAGTTTPPPTPDPEVTIAAGAASVTEGGSASFTLTATPAPAAPLAVTVTVAASGDYGITAGETTYTIPTTGTYTLTLSTDNDGADEAHGSVSVTVDTGDGYTVGTPSSGTVAIADDDLPPPTPDPVVTVAAGSGVTEGGDAVFTVTADRAVGANLAVTLTVSEAAGGDFVAADAEGARTVTILAGESAATLTVATDNDTADEANGSVTATVDAGSGYTVGTPSSGTVAIADDDVPDIKIAAGADVTEGTAATFTLTATPPPAAALQVSVTVAASGDYGITAGERTVTIPTTGTYTLTLATDNDGTDEPNGSVTATVDAGTGYTVGTASSGTVTIADDDLPPPAVSITAGASVTEGGDALFTVTADRAPDANLAVALTVTEAAGGDFVAAADEGARTVTIEAGKTAATLTVKTDDDTVDEPDGSVTATLAAGTGYTVAASPKDAASVAVADDDGATSVPVLSVESKSVQEGNTSVIVWATIDPFPSKAAFPALYGTTRLTLATIEGTAWEGVDYVGIPAYFGVTEACNFHTTLAPSGKHGCRIDEVTILDDSHDDGGETFQLEVGFADSEPARLRGLGAARGTITIENADPLPAAYLARFGRTVAEQALDGIAGRMTAPRTPGMQGTLAGQALSFDLTASGSSATGVTLGTPGASDTPSSNHDTALAMVGIARGLGAGGVLPAQGSGQVPGAGSGAGPGSAADPFGDHFGAGFGDSRSATPSLHSRSISARDALLGSHFSLTGETDASGGTMAFWGRAAQARFDGAERGDGTDITLDGTVTTGMLGADYARGDWLVGLALTQSSAEGGYAAIGGDDADPCPGTDAVLCDGALRAGDGEVEASLTAAIPYASVQASERLKLWGAAGYGTGEVTLKTMDERYEADTTWTMAAAGMRGDLLSPPR